MILFEVNDSGEYLDIYNYRNGNSKTIPYDRLDIIKNIDINRPVQITEHISCFGADYDSFLDDIDVFNRSRYQTITAYLYIYSGYKNYFILTETRKYKYCPTSKKMVGEYTIKHL